MSILAGDIKLIASEVMDDVPEGGGAPTAVIIPDGASNSVFNDISELDRAGGKVSLRKTFVGVQTNNRDGFFGANVIVADPPEDPLVSVTVFTTGSVFDRREDATSRVEAYLNAGPEWPGYLYENHITGQRSIQLFTRTNVAPPPVGRTLLLRMNEATVTEYEQYVRITRVTTEERTFTIPGSTTDYQALIVTCDLSDSLRFDFPGSPADRTFTRNSTKTKTRDTVVADAAVYYGIVPLTEQVDIGDAVVLADSVYTQLVPNARTETPLLDQYPSGDAKTTVAAAPRLVEVPQAPYSQRVRVGQENRSFNWVTIMTPAPSPGTVKVTYRALGQNYEITDNGDGTMGGQGSGTINYLTGSIAVTLDALPDDRSAIVFYWGQKVAYTNRSGQAGFRAPEYSFDLEHSGVIPGSVVITWYSGAVLKTATANTQGILSGDAVGDVNHNTGLVFIRPTAMIDAGGEFSISYQWSEQQDQSFSGLSPDLSGSVQVTLAQQPTPGSLEVSWLTTRVFSETSGSTSTAASSSKTQTSTSGQTSTKNTTTTYVDEESETKPPSYIYAGLTQLPGIPTLGNYSYPPPTTTTTKVPVVTTTETTQSSGANASTTYGASYTSVSNQTSKTSVTTSHTVTDDGDGELFGVFGTIGYVSKVLTVKVNIDATETSYSANYEDASNWEALNDTSEATATTGNGGVTATANSGGGGSSTAKGGTYGSSSVVDNFGSNTLRVRYKVGSATPQSHTETYTPPVVTIDLCPYTSEGIIPGSVRFTWMGTVFDDFEGRLYVGRTDVDPGLQVGGINYASGVAMLEDYTVSGSPTAFSLQSLWTFKPRGNVANVTFSTPVAPVVPGGLTLSILDVAGTQIIATANTSGVISGPHTRGVIDFETGLVEVQFGDYVLNSGLTVAQKAEWWYDVNDVRTADGKIWKPWPIDPDSLRYNVVAYSYLPLDANILGLDPVRLPQDGRVPIFRPGGFVVLGHTGAIGPATVSNGQTLSAGRVRLSRVRVIGANGSLISAGYTVDLEAGTVTFTDVTGYSQPVTVEHRVEDMAVVSEVQINGRIQLTRAATHVYPVPGSYLSSALVAGDLRARTSLVFDQVSWTSVWSDAQIGNPATGTFNNTANPITVANEGALTERWAVIFTNSTSFNVSGEHVGVIATGNTSTDCSPLNPATGTPYFTIPAAGWGLGWATGNVLRFNTVGAYYPVWVVRTIQQGPETSTDDSFNLLIRGDVDRP